MISWRSILRAAFTKFLPGAAGLILIMVGVVVTYGVQLDDGWTRLFAIEVISMAAGYAAVLGLMRRSLSPDSAPDSRKSVIVGAASAALLLAITNAVYHWTPSALGLASLVAGGSSAGLMFFPWLQRRSAAARATHSADEDPTA